MAAGNVDCSISEGMYNFGQPPINLNIFSASDVSNYDQSENCLSLLPTIPSNNENSTSVETVDDLTNHFINNHILDKRDNNKNITQSPTISLINPETFIAAVEDNKNPLCQEEFTKSVSCPVLKTQNSMPEELFINVESDDEGVHSWRPNMSSNSLCSDFFISNGLHQDNFDLSLPFPIENQSDRYSDMPLLVDWTSDVQNSPAVPKLESSHNPIPQSFINIPKFDNESHIHSQMAHLNFVRYEAFNASRRANELREEIKRLSHKFNEKLVVQRAMDIEKLREENAELRLECQCLCMEVDYYLKGKAPLGEINEAFYKNKSQPERNITSQNQTATATNTVSQTNEVDELEGQKVWDCYKCTFANHPAINFCEMCQTERLREDSYSASSTHSNYCHQSTT